MSALWAKVRANGDWRALLPVFLFLASYLVANFNDAINVLCFETGDYAVNGIQIERAKHFAELEGPYSRLHFHHPGPIMFYLYAFGEFLLSPFVAAPFSAYSLVQLAVNCLMIAGICLIIARNTGNSLFAWFSLLITLLALTPAGSSFYFDTWGPRAVVLPFGLSVVSFASVTSGDIKSLPWFVVSASFAVQPHLSTAPIVGIYAASLIFLAAYLASKRRLIALFEGSWRKDLIISAVCCFALNFPIVIDLVLNGTESNVARLIRFAINSRREHTLWEAAEKLSAFYAIPQLGVASLSPIGLVFLLCLLLLFSIKKGRFWRQLAISVVAAVCISVFSSMRAKGEIFSHLILYNYALSAILYFALFSTVALTLLRLLKLEESGKLFKMGVWLLFLALFAGIAKTTYAHKAKRLSLCNMAPYRIVSKLNPDRGKVYKVKIISRWGSAAGIILELMRTGYKVCVTRKWEFMFGKGLLCNRYSKGEVATLTVRKNRKFKSRVTSSAVVHNKTLIEVSHN